MKVRFVEDVRKAWRFFSVQVLALLALLPLAWEQLPPETHALIPEPWRPWIVTVLALIGIGGRLIKQGGSR